jgi:uncharacterized membrane protein
MVSWRKIGVVVVTLMIVLPAVLLVWVNNKPSRALVAECCSLYSSVENYVAKPSAIPKICM